MAILASDLVRSGATQLAAVGTQRYTNDEDYIPAINAASRRFEAYMGGFLAEKKGSEEAFRELTRTVIFQTNLFGGIFLDDPANPEPMWTLLALYAEPTLVQPNPAMPLLGPSVSAYRGDLTFAGSAYPVERITVEELAFRTRSLKKGSERLANTNAHGYAYYWVGDRSSTPPYGQVWPTNGQPEVIVIPVSLTKQKLVGVTYLRTAPTITNLGQSLPYPPSMFQLLRGLMLNEMSTKQGDGTTLNGLTTKEIGLLLNIQS